MEHRRANPHFRKILVGFDGSTHAEKALEVALSLAQSLDSKILLVAVARPPEPATMVELDAELDNAREHFQAAFARAVEHARGMEVEVKTDVMAGHPAQQLVHRAEIDHCDLIVLGRRGTSTFQKMLVGSVSEKVMRYAHCPVLVVK